MIECNKGKSSIEGTVGDLLSEYSIITKHIRESLTESISEDFAKRQLKRAFELGMMNEDEIDNQVKEVKHAILNALFGGEADDPD